MKTDQTGQSSLKENAAAIKDVTILLLVGGKWSPDTCPSCKTWCLVNNSRAIIFLSQWYVGHEECRERMLFHALLLCVGQFWIRNTRDRRILEEKWRAGKLNVFTSLLFLKHSTIRPCFYLFYSSEEVLINNNTKAIVKDVENQRLPSHLPIAYMRAVYWLNLEFPVLGAFSFEFYSEVQICFKYNVWTCRFTVLHLANPATSSHKRTLHRRAVKRLQYHRTQPSQQCHLRTMELFLHMGMLDSPPS